MGKRPMYSILAAFAAGILSVYIGGTWLFLAVLLAGLMLFGWLYSRQKVPAAIWLLLLLTCAGAACMKAEIWSEPDEEWVQDASEVLVRGQIYKKEYKNDRTILYLSQTSIQSHAGIRQARNIILYQNSNELYKIGNIIEVKGNLSAYSGPRNPGEFDLKAYYRASGIDFYMYENESWLAEDSVMLHLELLDQLKRTLSQVYEDGTEAAEASVLKAMILGEKKELDSDIKSLYQKQGIGHLLAISGLHISMLGHGADKLLRKCRVHTYLACILTVCLLLGYGLLTGAGTSTLRAVIMFTVSAGARITGRTYDMGSSAALAALLILSSHPLLLFQAGFLLSFGAIAGIVFVYPVLKEAAGGHIEWLVKTGVMMSISVNLVLFPMTAFFYYEYPPYSVLLNLIVIPLAGFVLCFGIAGGAAGMLWAFPAKLLLSVSYYILQLYEGLCRIAEHLPGASIVTGKPELWQISLYYTGLVLTLIFLRKNKKAAGILCLAAGIFFVFGLSDQRLEITMIDVGQGDGIYISTKEGITFLIDGGSTDVKGVGEYRIDPFLKARGNSKIDYAVITHADADHINGLTELIENDSLIMIKQLVLPYIADADAAYRQLEQAAADSGVTVKYISQGDFLSAGELSLTCLHPEPGYKYLSRNEYSTVLMLEYGAFKMLLTGDLEDTPENMLLSQGLFEDCNVLKAAHHGSAYSTSEQFLAAAKPEYTLISCGIDNSYGHPHPQLIERLQEADSQIYITAECGAVTIKTDGQKMELSKFIKNSSLDTW